VRAYPHAQVKPMPAYVQSSKPFIVRDATRSDVIAIMRLKVELAVSDDILDTVKASAADWERDSFGPNAHFTIFVAEWAGRVVGMAICGDRYFPGWVGPTIMLLDLCVEKKFRGRGVGSALLARVAEFAKAKNSVMIELTMRAGNSAARLYERLGFVHLPEVKNYIIAGDALERLTAPAAQVVDKPAERLAG
jgi:ribosomal protein S18 acetylase RimI-like enzyme